MVAQCVFTKRRASLITVCPPETGFTSTLARDFVTLVATGFRTNTRTIVSERAICAFYKLDINMSIYFVYYHCISPKEKLQCYIISKYAITD